MIIGTIVDGLVIDHIPAGRGMELYHYLRLDRLQCEVAIIKNATSQKLGRKDIIKIGEVIELDQDILGFISPKITVSVIRNGEKVGKMHPELPEKISDVIRCKNPRCITSIEQGLDHIFYLADEETELYRCLYCETRYTGKK